ATYPTGWAGDLTFEQISNHVAPKVVWKLTKYGVFGQDIPDSLQSGLMKLWEVLVAEPNLLADKTLLDVMWMVIRGSNSNWYIRYHRKYTTFTDITGDSPYDVDEFGISGLTSPSEWWRAAEPWATWAAQVDFRLDITAAIQTIVKEYDDDIRGLVALY